MEKNDALVQYKRVIILTSRVTQISIFIYIVDSLNYFIVSHSKTLTATLLKSFISCLPVADVRTSFEAL